MSFTITIITIIINIFIINNISCQEMVPGVEQMLDDQGWENMDKRTIASGDKVEDDVCVCLLIEDFKILHQKQTFLILLSFEVRIKWLPIPVRVLIIMSPQQKSLEWSSDK